MTTISKDNMINYIGHAIELEGAVLGQSSIIDKYQNLSNQWKPAKIVQPIPSRPSTEPIPDDSGVNVLVFLGILCLVSAGVFAILILTELPGGMQYDDGSSKILPLLIKLAAALGFGAFGYKCVKANSEHKRNVENIYKHNEQLNAEYNKKCKEIEEKNAKYAEQYRTELQKWEHNRGESINLLTQKLDASKEVLQTYYEPDFIFQKYRNLPALTSIYEYLTSGRCESLTGPDGAYNLYEMELRQNTVIAQLNSIITNLEQIRQNQYTLYKELTEITSNVNKISNDITAIRGYTYSLTELASLNAYYSAITASSTSAMAFLAALR